MHEQTRIGGESESIKPPESASEAVRLFEPAREQIPGQLPIPSCIKDGFPECGSRSCRLYGCQRLRGRDR